MPERRRLDRNVVQGYSREAATAGASAAPGGPAVAAADLPIVSKLINTNHELF